ncbi:MAG: hypothetical protein WC975_13875 [Phycisphaerae bacterium]
MKDGTLPGTPAEPGTIKTVVRMLADLSLDQLQAIKVILDKMIIDEGLHKKGQNRLAKKLPRSVSNCKKT